MSISVAFWGTRGTIPTPGPGTTRYGGNTACLSVSDGEGHTIILDAGTGIRALGQALAGSPGSRLDLFLSHVHWDHIQGLPFFEPMYQDGQDIHIHGPSPAGISLERVLERQLDSAVYPVPRAARPARVTVHEIGPDAMVEVPGFRVHSTTLSHPGGALGYRIEPAPGGPGVAYLTDNELGPGGAGRVTTTFRADLERFLAGAAFLVHDAMYTPALLAERSGWGHSSVLEAVELAASAGVPQLALFHHEPDHDDRQVEQLVTMARAAAPPNLTVDAAHEGWTVVL